MLIPDRQGTFWPDQGSDLSAFSGSLVHIRAGERLYRQWKSSGLFRPGRPTPRVDQTNRLRPRYLGKIKK